VCVREICMCVCEQEREERVRPVSASITACCVIFVSYLF